MAKDITNEELNSHIDQLVQHLAELMGDYDTAYKNYLELRNSPKYSDLDEAIRKSESDIEAMKKQKGNLEQDIKDLNEDKAGAASDKVKQNLEDAISEKTKELKQLEFDIKVKRKDLQEQKSTLQQLLDSDDQLNRLKAKMEELENERERRLEILAQKRMYLTNVPGAPTNPQPPTPNPNPQPVDHNPQPEIIHPISDEQAKTTLDKYAELLRAKEKWRNISILSGAHRKQNWFRKMMRKLFNVKKDNQILSEENTIREDFRKLVQQKAAAGDAAEMAKIYNGLALRLNHGDNVGWFQKFCRWMRKPAVAFGRMLLGIGLVAVGFLTGGAGIVAIAAGAGVLGLGAIGRFVGVDGAWDLIHNKFSTREKKGAYGMAGNVFYNASGEKITAKAHKVFSNLSTIKDDETARNSLAGSIDDNFMKYANRVGRNRFWKRLSALVAAVIPVFALKWLGIGGGEEGAHQAIPVKPPVVDVTQSYQITKGGSYWTMAEDIVKHNSPGSEHDIGTVTKVWKYLMENKSGVGITNGEMHPYTGATKPWLNLYDSETPGKLTDMVLHQKEITDINAIISGGNKVPGILKNGISGLGNGNVQSFSLGSKMPLKL